MPTFESILARMHAEIIMVGLRIKIEFLRALIGFYYVAAWLRGRDHG